MLELKPDIKLKKQLWSPILNIIAMGLIIASRIVSDSGWDWLTIVALILILVSIVQIVKLQKNHSK